MNRRLQLHVLLSLLAAVLLTATAAAEEPLFRFRDVAEAAGLRPHVEGIAGHAAAWGDVDGDGFPDLYVGGFSKPETKANMMFQSDGPGQYKLVKNDALAVRGRASGSVFADLDNDGDLDFYLSNLSGGKAGDYTSTDSKLYRNDDGKLVDISAASGACPEGFRGRSVAVLDYDGDGLLDLLLGEGIYYGSSRQSRLLRNLGKLKFEDVTRKVGLPEQLPALGVAAADVSGDGWPDIFFAARDGGNRLFINDGAGKFVEATDLTETFAWEFTTGDDSTAGVAIGDVDRDGRMDILVGHHYKRPWREAVPVRLYLNRSENGKTRFEWAKSAGLKPLPMKAPHVEIQDFDNDGWQDVYVSIVKFDDQRGPHPMIFRNNGGKGNGVLFSESTLSVNDFPTEEDRTEKRTGAFFDRMIGEGKIIYMAPGPSADFNRDGRLDLFLCNWWDESPSLLLENRTEGGHWLQVAIDGGEKTNRMGVGCKVLIYEAGKLGQADALLGAKEISVGYGYSSGQEAIAHLGLGQAEKCDLRIVLPHGKGQVDRQGVTANQLLKVEL